MLTALCLRSKHSLTTFFQVLATYGCKSNNQVSQSETRVQNFHNLIGWHSSHFCNWLLQEHGSCVSSVGAPTPLAHWSHDTRYSGPSHPKLKPCVTFPHIRMYSLRTTDQCYTMLVDLQEQYSQSWGDGWLQAPCLRTVLLPWRAGEGTWLQSHSHAYTTLGETLLQTRTRPNQYCLHLLLLCTWSLCMHAYAPTWN